jgi:DNA mismatch repair protein MutL
MPIRVLPIGLVNKIAAGEVIERPASVVKELVENALDAGATSIDVAVEDGGRRLIRVIDDGAGMAPADLELAFAPHATSKIATEDDLFAIRTMGFRGEALASIASVSRAHIRSRRRAQAARQPQPRESAGGEQTPEVDAFPREGDSPSPGKSSDDAAGYEVEAAGGEISPVRPCAAAEGTTITVRDLFYNVPARRKFLRTAATELGHVSEQVTRLALANPRVAFSLWHGERSVQRLPRAAGTLERARDLFGEELAAGMVGIVRRGSAVGVAGIIGTPASARASGKWQYFFLNGRYIRDRLLSHALREAYRGACDPNRWPVAMIFVEIDPAEVDVNVHPTKIEVRFRDSERVHGEVLAALRETLNRLPARSASLAGAGALETGGGAGGQHGEPLSGDEGSSGAEGAGGAGGADEQRRQSLRQAMADFFRSSTPRQPRFSFPEPAGGASPRSSEDPGTYRKEPGGYVSQPNPSSLAPVPDDEGPQGSASQTLAVSQGLPQGSPSCVPLAAAGPALESVPVPESAPSARASAVPPVAIQVHNSYILAGCEDGVLIVDQHALHERVLYNELKRRVESGGGLEGQRLLIPATVRVSPAEAGAVAAHEGLLRRLGMEVTPFGPHTVAVQEFPTLLVTRGERPDEFLRELLDKLAESPGAGPEAILEDVLAMVACKAAVKAGQPLARGEIESLLAQADLAERSFACPHGRPAVLKLTLRDLEKQFQRT